MLFGYSTVVRVSTLYGTTFYFSALLISNPSFSLHTKIFYHNIFQVRNKNSREKKKHFFFSIESWGGKVFALTQVLSLACDINPKLYKLRPNQAEIPAHFLLFLFLIGRCHDLNISKLTKCGVGLWWWQFWGA